VRNKTGDKDPEFVIDLRSPYYLDPSDVPGTIMTTIHFDGKNFHMWENAVIMALRVKNKISFIDGTITKPDMKKGGNSAQLSVGSSSTR